LLITLCLCTGFAQSTLHFDGDVSTQTTETTQNVITSQTRYKKNE